MLSGSQGDGSHPTRQGGPRAAGELAGVYDRALEDRSMTPFSSASRSHEGVLSSCVLKRLRVLHCDGFAEHALSGRRRLGSGGSCNTTSRQTLFALALPKGHAGVCRLTGRVRIPDLVRRLLGSRKLEIPLGQPSPPM